MEIYITSPFPMTWHQMREREGERERERKKEKRKLTGILLLGIHV